MAKLVAIHQPNFFPWLGYFDKLARADVFVVLDHVQFPKTGGTWSNRVQLLVNGQPRWMTMPIRRDYHGVRSIADMEIDSRQDWRQSFLQSIRGNYRKTPGFAAFFPFLEECMSSPHDKVADFNVHVLRLLAPVLGIDPGKMVLSSTLAVSTTATDMLIELTQKVGGTQYLCGGGSQGYLEADKFQQAGVDLVFQGFQHPTYSQQGLSVFVPGLSCLDAIFQCGMSSARDLLAPRRIAA